MPPLPAFRRPAAPRLAVVAAALATLCAVAVAILVATLGGQHHEDRPEATVRDFLQALTVDHDGDVAYTYLAPRGRRELADAVGDAEPLRSFLDSVQLQGPEGPLDTTHALDRLHLHVRTEGRRATVVIPLAGGSATLHLVDVGPAGQEEFEAPSTPWRIDGGLDVLTTPAPSAARRAKGVDVRANMRWAWRGGAGR